MNAFDILLRKADPRNQQQQNSGGKKRRTSDPHPAPTPAARRYTTCPICQRSLPSSFAELHAESCLREHAPPAATPPPPPPPSATPPNNPPTSTAASQPQQQLSQTPQLPFAQPAHLPIPSTTHAPPRDAGRHTAAAPPPAPPWAPRSDPACSATTRDLPMQPPAAQPDAGATQLPDSDNRLPEQELQVADSPGADYVDSDEEAVGGVDMDSQDGSGAARRGKDAFQVLMEGQRRQRPGVHVFFMERTAGGSWRWHWWQKAPAGAGEGEGKGEGPARGQQEPTALPECRWSASSTVSVVRGAGACAATLQLRSNVAPGEGGAVGWAEPGLLSNQRVPPEGRWRGAVPALKSALQKNVRLGRAPCAVRCAMQLLKEDAGELLRRLPIICLEDAILHPSLPFLVWVMAAHAKGFVLGADVCSELLRVTYQLASGRVRDYLPPANMCPGRMLRSLGEADAGMGPEEAALVKALLLRAAHGGMPGDVAMLRSYAALWAARFQGRDAAAPPPAPQQQQEGSASQQHKVSSATGAAAGAPSHGVGGAGGHGNRLSEPVARASGPALTSVLADQPPLSSARECSMGQDPARHPSVSPDAQFTPSQHHTPHHSSASGEAYFSFHLGGTGRDTEPGSSSTPAVPAQRLGFTPATLLMSAMVREQQALQQALLAHHPEASALGPARPSYVSPSSMPPAAGPCSSTSSLAAPVPCAPAAVGLEAQAVERPTPGHDTVSQHPERGAAARPGDEESQMLTPWLKFVHSMYDTAPPPQLVCAASIGPLRLSDVPLSAIDFHVSGVVPQLLDQPQVHAAAAEMTSSSWGVEGDPEACLRSAMWLFRSSLNHRRWLQALYPVGDSVAYEHVRLLEDLESEKAQRERLTSLWDSAAGAADQFSRNFIRRRFQPA